MEFFYTPIKLINNTKPIVKARQDYDVITKESQLFQETLKKFQVAFNELSDLPNLEVPTEQNSSLDKIIKELLKSLNDFNKAIHTFSTSLQNDFQNFIRNDQIRQFERDTYDKDIVSLNNDIINILDKTVKGNFIEIRNQLRDKINSLNKLSKSKSKSKSTEDIRNEYTQYRQLYGSYRLIQTKLNQKIDKLQSSIKNYSQTLSMTNKGHRAQLVSSSLWLIAVHLEDLGSNIDNSVSTLEKRKLKFKKDFTKFIDQKSIEFTTFSNDFQLDQFKRKNTALLNSEKDQFNIFPYLRTKFPDHIAKLKANFQGQNSELTVRKGQKVGILNEKDNFKGWSLCQNLFNDQIGYVPTDYLEKVGQGIVVVKNDLNIDGFDGYSGRMLTLIDKSIDKAICEDYCGKRATVNIDDLIILESSCLDGLTTTENLSMSIEKVDRLEEQDIKDILVFNSTLYKDLSDYERIEKIGSGSFSTVFKYKNKKTNEFYAFKIIKILDDINSIQAQRMLLELRREIIISTAFNDPTLQTLYGIIDDLEKSNRFYLITKFHENGDLQKMVEDELNDNSPFEWDITQKFIVLYGIASGMFILHQQGIIHRDLKSGNILLDENYEPLIADFGLSKLVDGRNSMIQTVIAGTPYFTAPEIFINENQEEIKYDGKKADVYAFSIICYQLFSMQIPYYGIMNQMQLISFVTEGNRPEIPEDMNTEIATLIKNCWNQEPLERPSFEQILEKIGSKEFLSKMKGIDIKRFLKYQSKVVPDPKFIMIKDEEELEDIIEFDSNNFTIKPSLLKSISDYQKIKLIAKGRSGFVFTYKDRKTGEIVAVKDFIANFDEMNIQREIWILFSFHHPAIQSLTGIVDDKVNDDFMLITPFYQKGDLLSMIELENDQKSPIEWDFTQKFIVLYGIAAGMYFLHKHDIIHRDLKPANILLNDNLEPIITDFGLSKFVDKNNTLFQSSVFGTPVFMAPEIVLSKSDGGSYYYDAKKADVYSFAILCYQLLSGISPFKNASNQYQLIKVLSNGERPSIPGEFNPFLKNLLESCWSQNPDERPTFEDIIKQVGSQEFIEGIENIDLEKFTAYQQKVVPLKFTTELFEQKTVRKIIRKSPIQIIKEMADSGDKESQYNYGCLLLQDQNSDESKLKEAVIYLKKAAHKNYVDAIIQLAKCLKEGIGHEKDEKEAFRLMQVAADGNDSEAQYNLGIWLLNKRPPDYSHASLWLKKAADNANPDPEAPAAYASILERGRIGKIPSNEEIHNYYKKSSDLGSPKGMYHMALFYHSNKNLKEAIRLYQLASSKGIEDAILSLSYAYEEAGKNDDAFNTSLFYAEKGQFYGYFRLYELYKEGRGVDKNEEKSNEYLKLACDKKFEKNQSHLCSLLSHGKGCPFDSEKAFFWAKVAADNGSPTGATSLARFFFDQKKNDDAIHWATIAAERGDVPSLRLLAKIYSKLNDNDKEVDFLNQASEKGDENSMIKLADICLNRLSKFNEALHWFKKAAENLNPIGCFRYGEMLLNGNHVEKDVKEGIKYLDLAADLNNLDALNLLVDVYKDGNDDIQKDEDKSAKYALKIIELKKNDKQ